MRSLLAMAATVAVLWAGLYVGMAALIAVLFGAFVGLAGIVIVMVVVVAVLATIFKAATGRRRVGAAIAVTLFAGAAQAAALAHFGQIPMMWVSPGLDLVYPAVAAFGALVLGLFLGPWWVRAVGAVAALSIVVVAVSVFTPERTGIDPNAVLSPEEQFAQFAALNSETLVSGAPGFEVVRVEGNDSYTAWERTPGGGVVQISYDDTPPADEMTAIYPCWMLTYGSMSLQLTDTIGDYANWCVPDGEGWARTDGTGFARPHGGYYVAVTSADESEVRIAGASRTANAAEVALALATLRHITEEEMRVGFQASIPIEPERFQ